MRKKIFCGLLIFLSMSVMSVWGWENKAANEMLLDAVRNQNLEGLNEAINEGANINCMDANDKSALMLACENQWYQGIKRLVQEGASVSFKNSLGQNALMFAAKYIDNLTTLTLLVDSGIPNIDDTDAQKKTALMYAVENKGVNALDLLLRRGANTGKTDLGGNDALIWAVKQKNKNAVKRLLEQGFVNWSQADEEGNTAFMVACENKSHDIVRMMVTGNSDFDFAYKTHTGLPILLWLIDKRQSITIINYVLEYFSGTYAELTAMTDDFGNDIYYYAEKRENYTVLDKLAVMKEKYIAYQKRLEERRKARKEGNK